MFSKTFTAACVLGACALALAGQEMPKEYQDVLGALGRKGDYKEKVLKINIPRDDLSVTVDGMPAPTPFGFGGWLAMTPGSGGHNVMMGDLVLLEQEVNPVMSAMLDNGFEVTALHNHFFYDQPRICYMHVMGHGTPQDLAQRVKPGLDLIGKSARSQSQGSASRASAPAASEAARIDTDRIAKIVGRSGEQTGPVYKITVGRDDLHLEEMGAAITTRMGLNTWAAFTGSDSNAMVAGDVAMLSNEVQPVLKALRKNGLEVVAIHQHMIGTQPDIIFLHYWGKGDTAKLAAGFKAALDQLGRKP